MEMSNSTILNRLVTMSLVVCCVSVKALITGPDSATAGTPFTISWSSDDIPVGTNSFLVDESTGKTYPDLHWPIPFTKSAGNYTFKQKACTEIPITEDGKEFQACTLVHSLVVSVDTVEPQSYSLQSKYIYTLREGDFDSNGRNDVLVQRNTSRGWDGSLQTVALMQSSNRTIAATVLVGQELVTALAATVDIELEIEPTDFNLDGYADWIISGLKDSIGASTDKYELIAPGGNADGGPLAIIPIDDNYAQFFYEIDQAYINPSYWFQNSFVLVRPVYSYSITCNHFNMQPLR